MTTKLFSFAFLALALAACAAETSSEDTSTAADQGEELKGVTCGGIAGLACPSGYHCVIPQSQQHMPDAAGRCRKGTTCIQNVMCAINSHFDTSKCECVPNDPGPTCLTLTCAQGTHCEMKGINGGSIAVCIKN